MNTSDPTNLEWRKSMEKLTKDQLIDMIAILLNFSQEEKSEKSENSKEENDEYEKKNKDKKDPWKWPTDYPSYPNAPDIIPLGPYYPPHNPGWPFTAPNPWMPSYPQVWCSLSKSID